MNVEIPDHRTEHELEDSRIGQQPVIAGSDIGLAAPDDPQQKPGCDGYADTAQAPEMEADGEYDVEDDFDRQRPGNRDNEEFLVVRQKEYGCNRVLIPEVGNIRPAKAKQAAESLFPQLQQQNEPVYREYSPEPVHYE